MRRTERHWAGMWTDIVIEQVQIRSSLKSRGGLTRGMTESVLATVVVHHASLCCNS